MFFAGLRSRPAPGVFCWRKAGPCNFPVGVGGVRVPAFWPVRQGDVGVVLLVQFLGGWGQAKRVPH
eukprot:874652-Lingulodinium_polyedra.AAC.1